MSKTSPNAEFNQEKRKLLHWISQWNQDLNHVQNIHLDISDLAILLQIMGYKLEMFDKINNHVENVQATSSTNDTFIFQIELACKKSGMKCKFVKDSTICKCPTDNEMEKGQFWSVTGCAPSSSSQNSINSSTSSLIPTIPKGKVEIISYLMNKIFSIISDKEVQEQKESAANLSQNAVLTRHRSLDTLKSKEGSGVFKEKLKRELSWEIDVKNSPPTQTSSPVPDLTHTLSRISLDSSTKGSVSKNLMQIQKLVNDTLEIVGGKNTPFRTGQKKRISDIKPAEGPSSNELCQNATPRKRVTPKRMLSSAAKTGIPTPTLQKFATQKTPTSKFPVSTQATQQVIFKSKLNAASRIKSTIGLTNSNRQTIQPSTSGMPKYRSLKK